MILKNICVGKKKEISVQGRTVKTAYLKEPQNGPVLINEDGPEGNETAVHTDSVYAFAEENYQYWADQLDIDREEWSAGFFAENLTISGLKESELCVGDMVAIGDSVQLVVSGPRVPCLKLCWRMKQPEAFIREFALSGKSGVYFNVLKTGVIKPGDPVEIVHRAPEAVLIGELVQYIFGDRGADIDRLAFILGLQSISETSKLLLNNQYYQLVDSHRTTEDRWQEWRDFSVAEIIEETEQVKSFILRAADQQPIAPYRAGQFLTVKLPIEDEANRGQPLIRVWSISDYQDKPDHYRLSIKKESNGRGSGFMHDQLSVGDKLPVAAPMGRFVLDRGGFKPILLLAGGIGITPVLSMLKAHIAKGDNAAPIYLVHCCQKRGLQPLRRELDELEKHHNVTTLHVFDQPDGSDRIGVDYDIEGFVNIKHIQDLLADCHIVHGGKRVEMPLAELDVYMCGPAIFQEKLKEALIESGANSGRIFQESFQASSGDNAVGKIERATVRFTRQGSDESASAEWKAEDNPAFFKTDVTISSFFTLLSHTHGPSYPGLVRPL
ncbi:MOSC domain-containing protein [Pseudomaricurvus alkylphenolicus]|uniref:MOSC domain-containing protein n=1 Tax=Pseudomaricurvus alkylphenolicus TaxID=1306991 RepID=UPI001423E06C|nr:MOSC domain-containing protein [Pseudomaricurvus alkylphenolicus]NIB39019.1 MOSC domain-containing protein [Pseudomaricurvus alkylphenolicus]